VRTSDIHLEANWSSFLLSVGTSRSSQEGSILNRTNWLIEAGVGGGVKMV
jgi:hypothetical protein